MFILGVENFSMHTTCSSADGPSVEVAVQHAEKTGIMILVINSYSQTMRNPSMVAVG